MLMSSTAAKPETINDNGDITDLSFLPSDHSVDIDKESFPTGIVIFHLGHRSIPIASTASNRSLFPSNFPGEPIQLAESFISESLAIPEGIIFVMTSATEIFAADLELINASGVRSPIAIASPDLPAKLVLHKP